MEEILTKVQQAFHEAFDIDPQIGLDRHDSR